jgi:hypothetical protein
MACVVIRLSVRLGERGGVWCGGDEGGVCCYFKVRMSGLFRGHVRTIPTLDSPLQP